MQSIKPYSRQSFLIIMFIMGLLFTLTVAVFYFGIDHVFSNMAISGKINTNMKLMVDKINRFASLQQNLRTFFVPISAAIFFTAGLMLWVILRVLLAKTLAGKAESPEKEDNTDGENAVDPEIKENNETI